MSSVPAVELTPTRLPHEVPVEELADVVGETLPRARPAFPLGASDSDWRWVVEAHDQLPDGRDIAPGFWLGVVVITPHFRDVCVAVRCRHFHTYQHVVDVVLDSVHGGPQDVGMTCVPTRPQLCESYATFVRFPSSVHQHPQGRRVVVLVDLTLVGGNRFACALPQRFAMSELLAFVTPLASASDSALRLYVAEETSPCTRESLVLRDGYVLTFFDQWLPLPRCVLSVAELMSAPSRLGSPSQMPQAVACEGVLVHHGRDRFYMPAHHHTGQTAIEAVRTAYDSADAESVSCVFPTTDLDFRGNAVSHILFVVEVPPTPANASAAERRRDHFALCDFRPVGYSPRVVHTSVPLLHLPSLAAAFGIRVPVGMRLHTFDGRREDDEVRFEGNPVLSFVFEECPEDRPATTSSGLFVDLDDDSVPWPGEHDGRLPRGSHQRGTESGDALPRHRSRSRSRGSYRGFKSFSPPSAIADPGAWLDLKWVHASHPTRASDEAYKWSPRFLHDALLESTWELTSVPALSANVGTKICPASIFSAALSLAPWSLKLLSEPESHSLSARDRIEDVRDFEEGEGRIWPYIPAQDQFAAQRLAERTAMDEETLGSEDASEFTFCLLTPGYTLEPVVVSLVAPVEIPDALQAVQEDRDPVHGRLYPALIVVDPQPAQGYGVLLALPAWPSPEVFICFSLLDIDDRLFVASAPLVASRERLLELAELEPAELYDVYVGGSPTPMVEAEEVDLVRGMCIFCYSRHVLPGPYFHLTESLLSSAAWERDPSLPYGPADGFMCLVGEFAQRRVPLAEDASFPDSFEIAAALGLHPERLVVQPAYPVTQDAALNGFYCYNVCAALDLLEHDAEEGPPCIVLIDCRALLQGWQMVSCPASVLSRTQLIEDLSTFVPPGWSVHLEGIPASSGIYEVPPGKVIYASYVPDTHPWQGTAPAEVTGEETEGEGSSSRSESSSSQASSHAPGIAGRSRSRSTYRGPGEGHTLSDTRAEGVPFLLLGQEYAPEMVIASQDSTEMSAVLQSVQSRRDATCRRRFAQIVPVHPQPAESYALAVVKPAWSREVYVVFDCLRVNGSVFCWLASAAMTRSAILAVAGFPATSDHEVYVPDQDLPLGTQEVCRLSTGACVSIVPRSCPWFVVASLQDMLLDGTCWSTAAALPCVPGDWLYVLSDTGPCCLQMPEARPDELYYTVADALGVPISQATFQLAIPPVDDYSDEGRIAWNIAVLTSTLAAPSRREGCVYFLDLRALMCGLTWAFTSDGVVSVALVRAQRARPAAGGHLVEVLGGRPVDPESPDEIHVWPGEVLVVQVLDVGVASPLASALPSEDPGPGDAHEDRSEGAQGHSIPSGGPSVREGPTGPSAHAGEVSSYGQRTACLMSLLSQMGVGHACVVRCVVGLIITSVLTVSGEACIFREAVLMLCFLRYRWHRQILVIAVMCASCMPLAASMQSRPVGSVSWRIGADTGSPPLCGALPLRAVATPCRARVRNPPSDKHAHVCHEDRGTPGSPLRTLLEESVQDDPESAFFNAATLLETLFEHFSSDAGSLLIRRPGCSASKDASIPHFFLDEESEEPPCELVLSSLLDFGNDADISGQGSNVEWYSLDCGSCLMPISDLHWQDLHHCVSFDHLLSGISGLQRPQRFATWVALHESQAFPSDAAEICLTSDGSFSEWNGAAGWGVVMSVMTPASLDVPGLYVGYIAGASNAVWTFGNQSQPINAFGSEIVGLFWAAVAAFQLPFSGRVVFRCDNQAALGIVAGGHTAPCHPVVAACQNLHLAFSLRFPGRARYLHVRGHAGDPSNELADAAANWGAGGFAPYVVQLDLPLWFANQGAAFLWLPHLCWSWARPRQGPQFASGVLRWELAEPASALSAEQVMRPFTRAFPEPQPGTRRTQQLCVAFASYNTLSLAGSGEDMGAQSGMYGQVGRVALLDASLKAEGVFVAGLQETRTPEGQLASQNYHRYCAGCLDKKVYGIEIWVGTFAGCPAHKAVVLHSSPTRMLLRLSFAGQHLGIFAGHGPHRGHPTDFRIAWWKTTADLCKAHSSALDWVFLVDANCSLGSTVSRSVGSHLAEQEDEAGEAFHGLLHSCGAWVPSTFHDSFSGDGGTLVQKRSHTLARRDFVALPLVWRDCVSRGYVSPAVHAGHSVPDHFAIIIHVELDVGDRPAARQSPRIDGEAILLPENSAAVEAVLSSLPVVSWDTNVNDHISILTDALYRGLAHKFPRQRRRMRQGFLSEETSRVHAELARHRHALRWRMAELRRCFLRCAFVAWQDAKGFFGVFQGLWIRHLRFAIAKLMSLVGVQGKQIRRLCRRDRAAHLNQLAAEVDDADASSVHTALRRLLRPKKFRRTGPDPLPRLRKPDGSLCQTPEEVDAEWRRHFSELEGGEVICLDQFVKEGLARQQSSEGFTALSCDSLPAFASVVGAFQRVKAHKAAGPDLLPSSLCRRFAFRLSEHFWPVILKTFLHLSEPLPLKGGVLHHIPKPNPPVRDVAAAQRGILVQSIFSKVLHRVCRPLPSGLMESRAPALQVGGRPGRTYMFGSFVCPDVFSVLRDCIACRQPLSLLTSLQHIIRLSVRPSRVWHRTLLCKMLLRRFG